MSKIEYYDDDLGTLSPSKKKGKKSKKHEALLDQLQDIEAYDFYEEATKPNETSAATFLPSSLLKESKKSKLTPTEEEQQSDEWFQSLIAFSNSGLGKGGHARDNLFEEVYGKKKKKKKKKEKGELTDYKKEFAPEIGLLQNLLIDQNRFTESLQREYDKLNSTKSSARGTSKTLNDLIENITGARSLSMQLVDKQLNAKKLIADLTLKEKKEFGLTDMEGANMSEFAATYLKQMISERSSIVGGGDTIDVGDFSDDEVFSELNDRVESDEKYDADTLDETNKYLEYENQGVEIYAVVNEHDFSDYSFVAKNKDGEEISDYPLPDTSSLSVNDSTNIATDNYGEKYTIIWK